MVLLTRFLLSHLFVSLCAALLTWQSYVLAGIAVHWPTVGLIFVSAWMAYNLSELRIGFGRGEVRMVVRGGRRNWYYLLWSLPLWLLLLTEMHPGQVLLLLLAAMMTLLYMMPFETSAGPLRGLRHRWVMKYGLLAMVWSLATVGVPLSGDVGVEWSRVAILMARGFLFIAALSILYDFRDQESDRRHGVRTLVVAAGAHQARGVALALMVLFLGMVWLDAELSTALQMALLLSSVAAMALILALKPERSGRWFATVVDGSMALQTLLVILMHRGF